MDPEASRVDDLARMVLHVNDPTRRGELIELASLLTWIHTGIPALQVAYPAEPPPAVQFRSDELARDFWRGPPIGG